MNSNTVNTIDILNELKDYNQLEKLHPVQDFVNEKLFYGFTVKDKNFVINSDYEIHELSNLNAIGLAPIVDEVVTSRFPIEKLQTIITDPNQVNPAELFSEIREYISRFIYLPEERHYDLLVLWTMGTYTFKIFRYFPYIHLNAEKNSGKTTLMDVLAPICFNGDISSNQTEAVIFREVQFSLPTMFMDEVEKLSKNSRQFMNTGIADVLKTGFNSNGAVKRCIGDDYKIGKFSSYCPKMLAGINELEEVLRDRTIGIAMIRKGKDETLEKYIDSDTNIQHQQKEIRDKLYMLGLNFCSDIFNSYKELSNNQEIIEVLDNRTSDLWLPIIAFAKLVDGDSTPNLTSKIILLAQEEKANRLIDDQEDNVTVRLVLELDKIIKNRLIHLPNEVDDDIFYYDAKRLHQYLQRNNVIPYSMNQATLSRRIRALFKETTRNYRDKEDGVVKKEYIISKSKVEEQMARYCN